MKPTAARSKPSAGSTIGDMWIYDFMDNDWTFPIGQVAAEDSDAQLPDISSSGSEMEVPLKCEPVSGFIAMGVLLSEL
jgi:hypothetical protein